MSSFFFSSLFGKMDNTLDNFRLAAKIVGMVTAKLLSLQEKKDELKLKFTVRANVLQNECFDSFVIRTDWKERGAQRKRIFLCLAPKTELQKTKNSENEMRNCVRESISLYQEFCKILETPVENLRDIFNGVDQKNDLSLVLYWIYDSRPKCVQIPTSHSPMTRVFTLKKFSTSKENEIIQDVKSEYDETLFSEFVSNLMLEDARIEPKDLHELLKNALQEYLCKKSQKKWPSSSTIMKKYLDHIDEELWNSANFLHDDSIKLHDIVRNYLNDQHQIARCSTSVKNYVNSLKNHDLSYIIVPETPPSLRCSRIKHALQNHSDGFLIITIQNLKEWRHIILKNICQNKELCTELILSVVSIDNEVKDFLKCIRGTCGVRVVSPTWKEEIHEFLQSLDLTYSSWAEKWSKSDRDRLPAFPLRRLAGSSSTHGVLFEAKMAALVALRARRRGLTFQLHANVAAVRPWDDLVLFVDGPGAPVTYLVQLKHGEKGGLVPLQAFQGSGQQEGDFNLNKYFDKFKELSEKYRDREKLENDDEWLLCNRNLDDFRFIIYTNKNVEKPSSMPQAGGSTDFPFQDIFETGDGSNTFSFQTADEVGQMRSDALFQQQFLPRMRVLGAQAHVDRLDALLAEEVRRELCPRVRPAVADECAHLYVQAFKRWLEGPGERVVSQASGELEAAVGEALRRRARAGAGGGALAFQDEHCARVRRALAQAGCVRVRVRVCVAGVRRGHRAAKVLQLLDADFPERWMYVDDQAASDLRVDDLLAASARCPVVVLDVKRVTPQVKDLVSKVAADPELKLVVLNSHSGGVRDFPGVEWQEILEDWRLEHLTLEAQNKMMDLEVSFQGALMPLRELQAQGAWPEEQLRGGVDGPLLSALIGCDAALGEAPPVDAGASSHVPRTLHHVSVLRREVLGLRNSASDHLVLSGFSAEDLRQVEQWQKKQHHEEQQRELCRENLVWNELGQLSGADSILDRWTILDENESSERRINLLFEVVCAHHPGRNVHLIQNASGKLLWRATRGNPEAISKFVVPWSETCKEPYAPRCIHERSALESAVKCQQRVSLLLGEPGIGKTSFLCSLAEMQREKEPHKWSVVLKLLDHVNILEDLPNENELDEKHVARLLAAAAGVAAPASSAARRCLEAALFHSGAVHVFVDGVDEVLPAYRDKTLRLLELLVWKTKAEGVWLAARPEVDVSSRCLLPCTLAILLPLSREEQLKYLHSKWPFGTQRQDIFEEVANKLLDACTFSPGRVHSLLHKESVGHSLLGVPFNLDLVIEAYTDDVKYAVENNDIFTPKRVSQLQLFQQFIQKQRERYKERYGLGGARSKLSYSSKADDDVFRRLHQNFAMLIWALCTSPLHQKAFQESVKNFEHLLDLEKSGIIWKLEDGRIQFAHYTFVEYFVATWLLEKVKEDNKNLHSRATSDCALMQLLETVYKNPQSRVMVFLDLMLAEGHPLHNAIIENDTETLTSLPSEVLHKDLGGRTALHVAAAYGRSDCVNNLLEAGSDVSQSDSLLQWTPLKYASATANLPTAEILLKKGANGKDLVEPVDIMQVLILDLVKVLDALMIREKGRSRLEDKYTIRTKSADSSMVKVPHLVVAANAGSKKVVDLLIKAGTDVESKDAFEETPLHKAALEGHKDIVDILISAGANIHCLEKNEFTPLHIASGKGHEEVVRLLLSKGADVFKKTSTGTMPIHMAAQFGHKKIVEMLIQASISNTALQVSSPDANNWSPLHYAAEKGHKDVIQTLINNGGNINAKTKEGNMPIHLSANHGHEKVIEVLLRHGAGIHSHGQFEATPLHIASYMGHVEVVRLLLLKGADVFKKAFSDAIPLHVAAQNGQQAVVEILIHASVSNTLQVNFPDANCSSPLHNAAKCGHKDMVETLLKNGANIIAKTKEGHMPIHISALHGHKEVIQVLLQYGADIHSRGQFDDTPLHIASWEGHVEVVRLLLSKDADVFKKAASNMMPIHLAAEKGHKTVVEELLQAPISNAPLQVSQPADLNMTPLHLAADKGHKEVVEILIEKRANVSAKTEAGIMPIHLSAFRGHKEVTEILLQNGADINSRGENDYTPLHCACENGDDEVVKLLLEAGAAVESCDAFGRTPLFAASEMGHVNVVTTLLSRGADANRTSIFGSTPLLGASWNGHLRVVVVLLHKGAHVNARNNGGHSALHLAAQQGHKEVVQVLLSRGADAHLMDEEGLVPLQLALSRKRRDIVKILLRESFRKANLKML